MTKRILAVLIPILMVVFLAFSSHDASAATQPPTADEWKLIEEHLSKNGGIPPLGSADIYDEAGNKVGVITRDLEGNYWWQRPLLNGGGLSSANVSGQMGALEEAVGCQPPQFLTECWSCEFVGQFTSLGMTAAEKAFEALAPHLRGIIFFSFMVWIMVQAMKMFSPDGNGLGTLKTVAIRGFVLLIVWIGLSSGGPKEFSGFYYYTQWIFVPIMSAGAGLSDIIMSAFSGGDVFKNAFAWTDSEQVDLGGSALMMSGMGDAMRGVIDVVNKMQSVNGWGFYIGWKLFGSATFTLTALSFSSLAALPAGLLLMFVFGMAFIAFPFYVIDLLIRVIFITALAPMAIASFLFAPTRRVTFAAINGLISSAATLGMMGAVVGFTAALIVGAMKKFEVATLAKFACKISSDPAATAFGFESSAYWFLLCAGILSIGTMAKARGLASALFGAGFDDGKSLGDKAAGIASRGMMAVGSTTVGAGVLGLTAGKAGIGAAAAGGAGGFMKVAGAMAGSVGNQILASLPGGDKAAYARMLSTGGMNNANQSGAPDAGRGAQPPTPPTQS